MNAHFFSLVKCYLKINGNPCGYVFNKTLFHEIHSGDLIEFLPENCLPIHYVFPNISPFVKCYEKMGFTLIVPHNFCQYPYLFEKKFDFDFFSEKAKVVVFNDSGCKILIQNQTDFAVFPYPFYPHKIEPFYIKDRIIALLFNEKHAFIFNAENKIEKLFELSARSAYTQNDKICFIREPPTMLLHKITYSLSPPFTEINADISRGRTNDLPDELKKYAFLECVAIGDDITDFLSSDLNYADKLKDFLGNYIAILPPPNDKYDYLLLYDDEIKFISMKTQNGRICDIILD